MKHLEIKRFWHGNRPCSTLKVRHLRSGRPPGCLEPHSLPHAHRLRLWHTENGHFSGPRALPSPARQPENTNLLLAKVLTARKSGAIDPGPLLLKALEDFAVHLRMRFKAKRWLTDGEQKFKAMQNGIKQSLKLWKTW